VRLPRLDFRPSRSTSKNKIEKKTTISSYDRERVDSLLESQGWLSGWINDSIRETVLEKLKAAGNKMAAPITFHVTTRITRSKHNRARRETRSGPVRPPSL
jgi:hypothetical protein